MLRFIVAIVTVVAAITAVAKAPMSGAQEGRAGAPVVQMRTTYDVRTTVPSSTGPRPAHIQFRNWSLVGKGSSTELPLSDFYIAHLFAGNVSTNVGGRVQIRRPDEYWTVAKGSSMVVAVRSESATLQTISVTPQ